MDYIIPITIFATTSLGVCAFYYCFLYHYKMIRLKKTNEFIESMNISSREFPVQFTEKYTDQKTETEIKEEKDNEYFKNIEIVIKDIVR
mgnify:FL=1